MKNFMKNFKNKALIASTAVSTAIMGGTVMGVFADTPTYVTDAWASVKEVLDYILWFAAIAGVIWAGWGVFQIVMGFKEEDAEKKNRGTMQLIAGMLLVMLRVFLVGVLEGLLGLGG